MTTDGGGLFGSPRRDGPMPKLVAIGIAWAAFGIVALITAVLMRSTGIAVFGVLCVLAGGGIYVGQRARERLEEDERSWRSDPGGLYDDDLDDDGPDDPDDEGADDRQHDTRVMSTGPSSSSHRDDDDIVDAEYDEYYETTPADQDDGTGYDDDETAFRRRREEELARDTRAREDDTQVIEADDEHDDDHPDDEHGPDRDDHDRDGHDAPRATRDGQR